MAIFLTRNQLYRLLQRELPEHVYADGAPSAFYTTADMDSAAAVFGTMYGNQRRIYENFWPQTAEEKIDSWEIKVFGELSADSLTLQEKIDRVLVRLRAQLGITIPDMISVVKAVIGSDKLVEIIEWSGSTGGWQIGESQLGIETYLNGYRLTDAVGPGLCEANPADYGFTPEEWAEMREQAYTYEVMIYGYTLTSGERAEIDRQLLKEEPARSQHVITDGLDPADMLNGDT